MIKHGNLLEQPAEGIYPTNTTTNKSIQIGTGTTTDTIKDSIERSSTPIVDSAQTKFYDNDDEIAEPNEMDSFFGQNASYPENQPSYWDNQDRKITDQVTGLMWQNTPNKQTYADTVSQQSITTTGGHSDWRLPTIKELYSLMQFTGVDPSGFNRANTPGLVPFINTQYFEFEYSDTDSGERIIDAQHATSTLDVGDSTFGGRNLMFGVNFTDGQIKGYPTDISPRKPEGKLLYILYVCGNSSYGSNTYTNNSNGTISDTSTGLMSMQTDSGAGMNWEEALIYANHIDFAEHDDWRRPNIKELQSIVD